MLAFGKFLQLLTHFQVAALENRFNIPQSKIQVKGNHFDLFRNLNMMGRCEFGFLKKLKIAQQKNQILVTKNQTIPKMPSIIPGNQESAAISIKFTHKDFIVYEFLICMLYSAKNMN